MQNVDSWVSIGLYLTIALGLGLVMVNIGMMFRPQRPDPAKLTSYESGMPPVGTAQQRYTVRYYVIAMLFVVFDIEAVFLYPWAAAYGALGWYGLIEMVLFIILLLIGYFYAWRKGALDWLS